MRKVAIVCMTIALSGCTALLVGGAGTAGYQLGKDERRASQVTRDGATTATIKSRLAADPEVSAFNVNVDTYANRVTLRGSVGSQTERVRAGQIAAAVEGVVSVDNRLEVVSRN